MATKRSLKKSPESLREKAAKAAQSKPRKRRVRTAASSAAKPIKRIANASTRQYHLITPRERGFLGFLTKPRQIFPRYFKNAYGELREVTWPSRVTTWKLVFAVFVFAIVFGVSISVVDYVLELVFKRVFL